MYGPFDSLIELAGFVVAASVGLVVLLWGRRLGSESLPAPWKRPFVVLVTILMLASLTVSMTLQQHIALATIINSIIFLSVGATLSTAFFISINPLSRPRIFFFINLLSVFFTSNTLLFGSIIVERSSTIALPAAVNLEVTGDDGTGASAMAALHGVETGTVLLSMDGGVEWQTSVAGPSGTAQLSWGRVGGGPEDVGRLVVTMGVPPSNGRAGAAFSGSLALQIRASDRNPASSIPVFLKIDGCKVNTPEPSAPPPGQYARCYVNAKLLASPAP